MEIMKKIITRADDCGSSHAANQAISEAIDAGFIKNVSVMGCGAYLEEAAEMMADRKEICFGLHACINSEWSRVTWGPTAPKELVPSLIDDRGVFYSSQQDFVKHPPRLEEILTEYRFQLEKVRKAGFEVRYVDSHMFPELWIPGLEEGISHMAQQEGLLDHSYYNRILPGNDMFTSREGLFEDTLEHMEGQYLMVMHPAVYSEEMCLMGNEEISGASVAEQRDRDYRFVVDTKNVLLAQIHDAKLLRYDQAEKAEKPYRLNLKDFHRGLQDDEIL